MTQRRRILLLGIVFAVIAAFVITRVVDRGASRRTIDLATENRVALDRLAGALIEHETLEADHVREVLGDVEPWTHPQEAGGARPSAVATSDHTSPGPVSPRPPPNGRKTP